MHGHEQARVLPTGLDMRFVGQRDGEDQDPNNVQAPRSAAPASNLEHRSACQADAGKGKGQGKSAPEPIRIGAIQARRLGWSQVTQKVELTSEGHNMLALWCRVLTIPLLRLLSC